jgi:thiol-disulfide isomerase/thioredoxin
VQEYQSPCRTARLWPWLWSAALSTEPRYAVLTQNSNPLIKALRGAKDELNRKADAGEVLNDHRSEIFDDPATPVGGNPQGDVTIVEFFDYRCPYCKQVQPLLQALLDQDHKLRFIYKEMPVLGSASVVAARAALAAWRQGRSPKALSIKSRRRSGSMLTGSNRTWPIPRFCKL